jgi:hypothetical protein
MYCSNLSCKFSRQTQKKLVGFSHYGHFSSKFLQNNISRIFCISWILCEIKCANRKITSHSAVWVELRAFLEFLAHFTLHTAHDINCFSRESSACGFQFQGSHSSCGLPANPMSKMSSMLTFSPISMFFSSKDSHTSQIIFSSFL